MPNAWPEVASTFHQRVRANCWDTLAGELLRLHEPHICEGMPVCHGCDREPTLEPGGDPVWPCRTYTIIAATMLHVREVETTLTTLLDVAEHRLRYD